jgi:hypothetical protein
MIAAIATDTERAGTVVAMDIMIKAASTIAVAETIAMVATRASNGRDAAKAACWPSREEPSTDLIEPAMAGTLPDIAGTIIKNRGRTGGWLLTISAHRILATIRARIERESNSPHVGNKQSVFPQLRS